MNITISNPEVILKTMLIARTWYLGIVWGLALVICVLAIYQASQDQSWDAAWIALFACPFANLILMIGALIGSFMVSRMHPAISSVGLYASAFTAPIASAGVAFLMIIVFNVHRTPV